MVLNNVVSKGVKYLMTEEYNSIGIPSIPDALPFLILPELSPLRPMSFECHSICRNYIYQ